MRSSTLLTTALTASALALPQGQLEKRQQVTVFDTVTVTTTVYVNPFATPAWQGPPHFSEDPNTRRPAGVPSQPVWVGPPRFSENPNTRAPVIPNPSTPTRRPVVSPTPRPSPPANTGGAGPTRPVIPSPTRPVIPSPTRPVISSPTRPVITSPTRPVITSPTRPVVPVVPSPPSLSSSSSAVVGSPVSNPPVSPSGVPPTPPGAPLDPGHTPGVAQASLSVASGAAYRNSILYHHNARRANHGAAPLVWNDTVAATARITAETCRFEHYIPPGVRQGQNLFTVSGNFFNVTSAITESWYKEEFPPMVPYFGAASIPNSVFPEVGHLTQLLWKGTTSVGCYSLDCGDRMIVGDSYSSLNKYTVCNYWPAGNVATQYGINVGRPISTTNLGSWTD